MRSIVLLAAAISMFLGSSVQASPFSTPPETPPPFDNLPPSPDVPPAGEPPFDLGFEIPVGPPSGLPTGPGSDVPVGRPVGLWMMTLPSTANGLELDVPLGPPADLPPVSPPFDLDTPPFSEFPPDFEAPPFFDELPPGILVRPFFAASGAVFSGGTVPEPSTALLLVVGLTGLAWTRRKGQAV